MIKELRLKNWKSFEDATLYIDPLTILIGPNASGKSNALDALLFLHRVSSGVGIFQAINGDVNLPALRGGMEWVCRQPSKQFTIEVLTDSETQNQDYLYELHVFVSSIKAEVYQETLSRLIYDMPNHNLPKQERIFGTQLITGLIVTNISFSRNSDDMSIHGLSRNHTILSQIKDGGVLRRKLPAIQSVFSQLSKIAIFDPIPSHMRNYAPLSEKLAVDGSNIAGVLAGLDLCRKEEVEATLTSYLKSLPEQDIKRVWTETVGKFNSDAMLYCEESWGNAATHEIDARGMSDGTLRYLAIVTALLIREKGSLLVIEEVDNGLHPSRARLLIDMLRTLGKERGIDVIVTTHNPALLDAAGIKMLPFITVAHRDNKTGVSQLIQLEDIEQLPKLMASSSLGKLNTEGRIESALKYEDAQ